MKFYAAFLGVVLLVGSIAAGAFTHGNFFINITTDLKIGGGGLVVGQDEASIDGTQANTSRCVRTDAYGAYCWSWGANQWCQVVKNTAMPAANFGWFPTTGTSQVNQSNGGPFEIAAAPSSPNIGYMVYNAWLFRTTNLNQPCAVQWTVTAASTAFGQFTNANSSTHTINGPYRINGRKMAVDPNNPNILYIGTPSQGVVMFTDGGASTFTSVSAIPTSTADGSGNFPSYAIAFDPASGTTGGATNTIYVAPFAVGGVQVYQTTNAGSSWAATTSGPTSVQHMVVCKTGGNLWAISGVSGGGDLWEFSGGTWAHNTTPGTGIWHSVACNPSNAANIVLVDTGGELDVSSNTGVAWSGRFTFTLSTTDAPWIGPLAVGLTTGDMQFDPTQANTVICDCGQGVYSAPVPNAAFTYTQLVNGIEELVANNIIVPQGGLVYTGVEDEADLMLKPFTNQNAPATSVISPATTLSGGGGLPSTFGMDYASSDPTFILHLVTPEGFGLFDLSGTSTAGDQSTFRPFNSWNTIVAQGNLANNGSGLVRVTLPSTSALTTWANGSGSIVTIYCTSGVTFGVFASPGQDNFPVTVVDTTHIDLQNSSYISLYSTGCAGGYLVYVSTAPLSSHNGNYNIVNLTNSSGAILVTFHAGGSGILNGEKVCLSGVTGTTEANGCWVVTGLSGNTLVLFGSTFTHAYAGGGQMFGAAPYGGYAAASTPSNFIVTYSNADYPYCTTDGGQTFTRLQAPSPAPAYSTVLAAIGGTVTTGDVVNLTATAVGLNGGVGVTASYTVQMGDTTTLIATGLRNAVNANATLSAAGITAQTVFGATGLGLVPATNLFPVWTFSVTGAGTETVTYSAYGTGWAVSYFDNDRPMAADRVTANTFYAYNFQGGGLYKITNCGTPVLTNNGNNYTNNSTYGQFTGINDRLRTPNEAGQFFFTGGPESGNGPTSHPLWHTCDQGTDMLHMPGTYGVQAFGFGAPAPGKSFQAIYAVMWFSADNVKANAVFGIYRSTDDLNHGVSGLCNVGGAVTASISSGVMTVTAIDPTYNLGVGDHITFSTNSDVTNGTTITGSGSSGAMCGGISCTGTGGTGTYLVSNSLTVGSESMVWAANTWTKLDTWGRGWMSPVTDVSGDPSFYGAVYISTSGAGLSYGTFNYLLNRDLSPGSNDNSPAWLNEAA